jgi:hypothetical protein
MQELLPRHEGYEVLFLHIFRLFVEIIFYF